MDEASVSAAASASAVSAAERTKGRQSCRVLADLNKHGIPPFLFLFLRSPTSALKTVSAALMVFHGQSIIISDSAAAFVELADGLLGSLLLYRRHKMLHCIMSAFGTKRHSRRRERCPLLGVKRTSIFHGAMLVMSERHFSSPWSNRGTAASLIAVCLLAYGVKKIFEELFAG
jgi:hypothetical protein